MMSMKATWRQLSPGRGRRHGGRWWDEGHPVAHRCRRQWEGAPPWEMTKEGWNVLMESLWSVIEDGNGTLFP